MRFVRDASWSRPDRHTVVAGSPHRLFRVSGAGVGVLDALESGRDVGSDGGPASAVARLLDRLLDAGAIHPVPAASDAAFVAPERVTIVTPQLGGPVAGDDRITVDDASDPPLLDATLRLEVNLGPGGARNAGRDAVGTSVVLFLDADVDVPELSPSHPGHHRWWMVLLSHFDDPLVGLVAPRVIGDDGSSLDLGDRPGRVRQGTRVSYVPGAAMLVRTAAFDDVGGFDPTLRVGEDVDFVWRLDQAGWRCRYEPAAAVTHRPRPTSIEQLRQQVKYGSSSGALALRHPGALTPYRSGIWSATVWALVALGRPRTALAVGVGSVAWLAARADEVARLPLARIAATGHLRAGAQLATAIRRAWWPLLVPLLASRRVRRLLVAAALISPRTVAKDIAFSVGVWRSALAARTTGPLRPVITHRSTRPPRRRPRSVGDRN
ncbi:MAG: glycosyltransferase family 2 protein [Actinomycetota bacterium]